MSPKGAGDNHFSDFRREGAPLRRGNEAEIALDLLVEAERYFRFVKPARESAEEVFGGIRAEPVMQVRQKRQLLAKICELLNWNRYWHGRSNLRELRTGNNGKPVTENDRR